MATERHDIEALERAISLVGLTRLSNEIGVKYQMVQQWRNPERVVAVPVEYCWLIEKATDGKVRREELRPNDWQKVWPELSSRCS